MTGPGVTSPGERPWPVGVCAAALPMALHVKDLEISQGASWPAGPGWISYRPQRPLRFRTLGRGQLPSPAAHRLRAVPTGPPEGRTR
jgi:hypothetical protein